MGSSIGERESNAMAHCAQFVRQGMVIQGGNVVAALQRNDHQTEGKVPTSEESLSWVGYNAGAESEIR
jgi:hypothetical protein